jgi:serine/threonine protein kinase
LLNQGHGKGVDWWTLGVLIFEMHAGYDPFSDEDPMMTYQNILKNKPTPPKDFDK